jgi:uncharacterized coiled-coil protein SlyX
MAESSQQRYERSKELDNRISELEQKLAIAREALKKIGELSVDRVDRLYANDVARAALEKLND